MIANSGLERRRLWVALMYSGLSGWTVQSLIMGVPSLKGATSGWIFFAVFFAFAALGAFGFLVNASTMTHVMLGLGPAKPPQDTRPDERQRTIWDRALRKAYVVVLAVLLVVTGYLLFVWPLLRLPRGEILPLLSIAIFLLALSLPNAIVAWTEPDPEPEEL